ncbi:hypothetical protein HHK36_003910 [Tetracentron sinense]|uniref:NAB domain-containing protein n=1 Tax=Tetracentron sinense TaxID=13715 RepID=A0A835DPR9_TETSI|nr:hypothetical protein HHK36_003910 [Tetracentron sinense]
MIDPLLRERDREREREMLQRAASNAYSWWWASHVRTKQSKWLEQNLQDMQEKVKCMLKLIEEDGDSFAKRAEMYYRKRPELINFVEESYRAYRALAERYDHISGELQNANHTIATVFPEQVQFAMDEEDENNSPRRSTSSLDSKESTEVPKPYIPKVPEIPKKDAVSSPTLITKKVQPRKTKTATTTRSGMSKPEALEEIDKLQKGILALQTEKEFVKSSYESGLAKYWEIENRINEMQGKVCSLQDEFSVGMVIEDDEARTLMAATALKSCQETLMQLQEKQEQSAEEARVEYQRIKDAYEKLESLKDEYLHDQADQQKFSKKDESVSAAPSFEKLDQEFGNTKQEKHESELLREKIREHFKVNSNASLTVTELAEKIDELVNKVISLETAVSSQTALVKRLKSETDELQAHLQSLEEGKVTMADGSNNLGMKLRELEEELRRIQDLNRSAEDQKNNLQTHFTEAHCNLDHLSKKLQCVKPDEETDITGSFQEEMTVILNVEQKEFKEGEEQQEEFKEGDEQEEEFREGEEQQKEFKEGEDILTPGDGSVISEDRKAEVEEEEEEEEEEEKDGVQDLRLCAENKEDDLGQSKPSDDLDDLSEKCLDPKQQDRVEEHDPSQIVDSSLNLEPNEQATEQEDQPNWQQLFLNGLKDREKILLAEYTSILRNYKEVKKKLSELDKKNRDSLFETTVQLRELKSANTMKDKEIQSLRQKLSFLQTSFDENLGPSLNNSKDSQQGRLHNSMTEGSSSQFSNIPSMNSDHQPVFDPIDDQNVELTARNNETTAAGTTEIPPSEEEEEEKIKVILVDEPHAVSTIEEKLRADIDELLEENLEFWLRFSTSFHQIQKFQTAIQDLQAELSKLKRNKKQEDSTTPTDQTLKSDVRPIYKHLREIQTELTVWLEQNALLKEELQYRFSSLCNIQEEISKVSKAGSGAEEAEFTSYQAAKFQGEVVNMQQENNKVADELQAGLDHVRGLQFEIEKTLSKLNEDLGLSGSKNRHSNVKHSTNRSRVPLRSFLFGVRPKKQKPSIFACMNPAFQKQYSDLRAGVPM